MRPEGHTYRDCLRAILHCCDEDRALVLFVFSSEPARDHGFYQALNIINGSMNSFFSVQGTERFIHFRNDSRIYFRTTEYVTGMKWIGGRWTMLIRDNSLSWMNLPNSFDAIVQDLKIRIDEENRRRATTL